MRRGPSLTLRLVSHLIAAQLIAFTIGWIVAIGLDAYDSSNFRVYFDLLGGNRSRDLVLASLVRGRDGVLELKPTAELRAELSRNPRLKFAVLDVVRNQPAKGSAPELIKVFAENPSVKVIGMDFAWADDPGFQSKGAQETRETPLGRIRIAVYGFKFRWDDLFRTFGANLKDLAPYILAVLFGSAAIAWIAVRQGLTPLRSVSGEMAQVDMNSLEQRLPETEVPAEILPLVVGMNHALGRLDASAARQRRFIANAAHELRTPVAILSARLGSLKDEAVKAKLQHDTRRIQYAVEQLLAATRLAERPSEVERSVDLRACARSVTADLAIVAINGDRQLAFEASPAPVIVRGTEYALDSVIANLINNALRAEPKGGTVVVRVREDATLEVADHGEGVAESDREQIFEPFWRKSEATPGTGLGLAIAKQVMETLGGRIVVGDTPGGGATFKLSFPRMRES